MLGCVAHTCGCLQTEKFRNLVVCGDTHLVAWHARAASRIPRIAGGLAVNVDDVPPHPGVLCTSPSPSHAASFPGTLAGVASAGVL